MKIEDLANSFREFIEMRESQGMRVWTSEKMAALLWLHYSYPELESEENAETLCNLAFNKP